MPFRLQVDDQNTTTALSLRAWRQWGEYVLLLALILLSATLKKAAADGPAFPDGSVRVADASAGQAAAAPPTTESSSTEAMPARWLSDGLQDVERVWDYKLAEVQADKNGKKDQITVGTIVDGVVLFLAGIVASRYISRFIGRRLLSRMGVNTSAAAAFQSVAFYVLFLIFTLLTLNLLDVPLTAFTVLGGALALGFGFGSQNIVNNFISGLILLAERPVKVGDLIQVGDLYGNVEHIGARSTRVKTGDNLDIIVPNSTFLQTNVINWTRNDNQMRTCVKFGVMYGSPMGKVRQLALKAVANHNGVFDQPPPVILFAEFGDNALQMELHFWVAVHTLTERQAIESDIRFNIEHLFREAGLVIAYPQRDMHLFASEPLRVQMLPAEERGQPDAA
ncbi:MAG TPA: mechanosensitive ion channel domain-containing protein [Lacipirellulaceae bacterium]|jgi:small-conductance mechanosensitive channel